MSGDLELKEHVEEALNWEPNVDAAAIGIAVNNAVVTLSGHVANFAEKRAAEQVVMRIRGVRALANEIEVKFLADGERTDEDIALTAASVLNWNPSLPKNRIKIKVTRGWITLEGIVDWNYQQMAAEMLVENLMGVKGVTNLLSIKSAPMPSDVKEKIEDALRRAAEIHAQRFVVAVQGNKVTLSGRAESLAERRAAELAAWKAPGVCLVENNIEVQPVYSKIDAA